MIKIVRAKLHGIRVTGADLDYHGSVTLDPVLCNEVGIYPLEFVDIWNKSTGARFSTYVIFGKARSRCCILNGAAARLCQKGDEVIIAASEYIDPKELVAREPKVLMFDAKNKVVDRLKYAVGRTGKNHRFAVKKAR
jgi:aspartate 1-decarboxylase